MIRVLLLFLAMCAGNVAFSQSDTLYIFSKDASEPLMNVYIVCNDIVSNTDYRGEVILKDVKDDDVLIITHIGYEELRITLAEVNANSNRIYLIESPFTTAEVEVSAVTRATERRTDMPSSVSVINSSDIALYNPQTSADALTSTGHVFLQKSQMGGGSPIIRGFEANKVLIAIDGVRMNNAIYRSGHLQNVITIDNAVLDRVEVVYGPASVMYGSDALGGVMHFYTKSPKLKVFDEKGIRTDAQAYTRYSSANFEKTFHLDFNLGGEKWAGFTSATLSDYDDLRAGSLHPQDSIDFYWGRPRFVQNRLSASDTILSNSNPNLQVGSGYAQFDLLQKIRYRPSDQLDFIFNMQYSTSSNVPRYDQLTSIEDQNDDSSFEYAEWYYGPQKRLLTSLTTKIELEDEGRFFNTANLILAYQDVDEDRFDRNLSEVLLSQRREDVDVISFNADFIKRFKEERAIKHKLLYGMEFNHNWVQSTASNLNILTKKVDSRTIGTRYPDGGSRMSTFAAYLSHHWKPHKKLSVISGARYTYVSLLASFQDTVLYNLDFDEISLSNHAVTGSVGLAYRPGNDWAVNGVLSNAFRAPNVDDFGKVRAKGSNVTIPNKELKSEKSVNGELSIGKVFDKKHKISITSFYTYLFDVIVQVDVKDLLRDDLEDSIYYDGNFLYTQTNINAGQAIIYGVSGQFESDLSKHFGFQTGINFIKGLNISENGPLAHIPPLYGHVSLSYERLNKTSHRGLKSEFILRYNGAKTLDNYSDDSSDNLDQALPSGTPAWFTLNLYNSYYISKSWSVGFNVENILDWHYRPFSSGISAPGLNFVVSMRGAF